MDSSSTTTSHFVVNMEEDNNVEKLSTKETQTLVNPSKSAQNVSTSIVRKKSDSILIPNAVRFRLFRLFLANFQEVVFGTKLAVLFPAIPLAIVADFYKFGRVSYF